MRSHEEFQAELLSLGASRTERDVVRFSLPFTLREQLDRISSRSFSDAWDVPEDHHAAILQELRAWVKQTYGDLDQPHEDPVRFVIDLVRFPPEGE